MTTDGGLRALFRANLPRFDFQAIEMGERAAGVPDLNYCCDGADGFIELKKADAWRVVSFRPEQVAWITRRVRHGGRVYVAVRRARDELWLFAGRDAGAVALRSLREIKPLGLWRGGPRRWDWDAVARILTGAR